MEPVRCYEMLWRDLPFDSIYHSPLGAASVSSRSRSPAAAGLSGRWADPPCCQLSSSTYVECRGLTRRRGLGQRRLFDAAAASRQARSRRGRPWLAAGPLMPWHAWKPSSSSTVRGAILDGVQGCEQWQGPQSLNSGRPLPYAGRYSSPACCTCASGVICSLPALVPSCASRLRGRGGRTSSHCTFKRRASTVLVFYLMVDHVHPSFVPCIQQGSPLHRIVA